MAVVNPVTVKIASELVIMLAGLFRSMGHGDAAAKIEAAGKDALSNYGTVKSWSQT